LSNIDLNIDFTPSSLRAFTRNEAQMTITLKNLSGDTYWSECEVVVSAPLSLAHDSELNMGRTRLGILKPLSSISKPVKLFTRPNNYPDEYTFNVVAYVYDSDAAIAERLEKRVSIMCVTDEKKKPA
jgi:hypothetical protein